MLRLELPFRLAVKAPRTFFRRGYVESGKEEPEEVVLEGLAISIRTGTKIYEVAADRWRGESAGPSCGTSWTRWHWTLSEGITFEQQMAIPVTGDALAISWRSIGRPLFPCHFAVSPIFSAVEPFAQSGFRFEPETNGGRLAWRPFENSSRIIADTNGRFDPIASPSGVGVIPAAFEFTLSPQPAVLILSSESPRPAGTDPLIGGFPAHLSSDSGATIEPNRLNNLAIA